MSSPEPNIIVVMCDQLRAFETGCYGNPIIRTPHIDRLAGEGVRFEYAVTNNPVCMPARSSLLSGQYSRSCIGTTGNITEPDENGRMHLPEYPSKHRRTMLGPTLPEELNKLGYRTALIGKWHIDPAPETIGFEESLYPYVHHRHTGQTFIRGAEAAEETVAAFSVEFEADQVERFLAKPHDRPFFLYYNISPPHMPLDDAPEDYKSMYSPESVPLRPNVYDEEGKPAYDEEWFKIYLWDFLYYQHRMPHTAELPEGFDLNKLTALYYGLTTWVDDTVGKLMDALKRHGHSERTIVVFLSDHGDNLGSHGHFNKSQLYDESIRIPLVFHSPAYWDPRINGQQVAQIIDIMPTLLDIAGGIIPDGVQGRSLKPILDGTCDVVASSEAYVETDSRLVGIRTAHHLYGVRLSDDFRSVEDDRAFFFDLRRDPYEMNNLAGTEEQPEVAAELRSKVLEWIRVTPWLNSDAL
ncbi:sulfatase family protein [Paenibacillus spongiae]|uniref:Sulfatase-like hydrolase/transferase n=1 Tax=Paenibacillus spongiae TaxID=2909671 RepID=A0ABY5SI21_9BACL|nr:sulfatase-like hydrolase/transferase [Paenibacillus spongiae]UVI33284.1 sulfatase-like hydrolase/transferase [Paenibacillus spongiae]